MKYLQNMRCLLYFFIILNFFYYEYPVFASVNEENNISKKRKNTFLLKSVTSITPKRLIYFIGHPKSNLDSDLSNRKSVLITQICKNYETISSIFTGESATRTLWSLYNLHAVRGIINNNELIFETSMSGPHHYFGFLDPTNYHIIKFENNSPIYYSVKNFKFNPEEKIKIPNNKILKIHNYIWFKGKNLQEEKEYFKKKYNIASQAKEVLNEDNGQVDSIIDYPGILELEENELNFDLIENAYEYDLSDFRAEVVPNDQPFAFDQELVKQYKHAQHKLRVITYNYADRYITDYLMNGNGIFIERHEFIQSITPTSEKCGGYVVLGKEKNGVLELIAVTIPFGFTLLVNAYSIHGDSTLIGLYSMAMTGNHLAMQTGDVVYIKNIITGKNVRPLANQTNEKSLSGDNFLLTSNSVSLYSLIKKDDDIKKEIYKSLSILQKLWWRPVIFSLSFENSKTLGSHLPKIE